MSAYTVHVVDDDAALLRTLGRQLSSDGYKVYLYQDSTGVLADNDNLWRGCLLIDVSMPRTDGLSLPAELRQHKVDLPAVIMSDQPDPETIMRAAKLGASQFLGKPCEEKQLFLAIVAAMTDQPAPELRGRVDHAVDCLKVLSPRESEVLSALARGDSHKAIAFDLGISVRTVEIHSARMLRRLGLRRLAEAIRLQAIADLAEELPSAAAD